MKKIEADIDSLLHEYPPAHPKIIEAVVREYYDLILRLGISILHDKAVAEDATQDTFIVIANKMNKYEVGSNFRAWLYTIAVNTCRGYIRKRKVQNNLRNTLQAFSIIKSQSTDPEESISQNEEGTYLWGSVRKLGEKHRMVIVLRIVNELTIREISQILSVPEKTVYNRLYDALKKLRVLIKSDGNVHLIIKDSPSQENEL